MDIRQISDKYAVSPQISVADIAALAETGFTTLINNRPDTEVTPDISSNAMRLAAEAAGMTYVENPVINGGLTMDMVQAQKAAVDAAEGAVFAYCRSGTRSSIVWALAHAGALPTDQIIAALDAAGYQVPGLSDQIESLAAR